MATVTQIREYRGVIHITLNGRDTLKVRKRHFAKLPLEPDEEIDLEAYIGRLSALQFPDAYEAALSSLDFGARTEKELSRSLVNKGFVEPVVEAVIARLVENRLIDDKRYAQRTVEINADRPVGFYAVKRKLRAKGISDIDTQEALEALDGPQQTEAAKNAAAKLSRKYAHLPMREARGKLSQALARRGFPWDAIREAVDTCFQEDDWE